MKAIMTVTGKDHTGIVAAVAVKLAELDVNILDISQTIMDEYFTMILMVETKPEQYSIRDINQEMEKVATEQSLSIRTQATETFDAMHRI